MIYIVLALMVEAKPVIKHYNLKKCPDSNRFPIYKNDEITLIVSGTGLLKSAVATSFLVGSCNIQPGKSCIINYGICGGRPGTYPIGTVINCNKIIDKVSGRSFYPDLLVSSELTEDTIETSPVPVLSESQLSADINIVDMEAAGFAQAAFTFFPPHNIYCVKIISDHLNNSKLDKDVIDFLIKKNIKSLDHLITKAKFLVNINNDVMTSYDYELIERVTSNLKLSFTMKHQLILLVRRYKLKYDNDLKLLNEFMNVPIKSKKEGKLEFERLSAKLS